MRQLRAEETLARGSGPAAACEAVLRQVGEMVVAQGLWQAMTQKSLTIEGAVLCHALRPKFVSDLDYQRLVTEATVALDLFGRAELEVRLRSSLRHSLFGSHPYAPLIEAHLDYDIETVGRLDAMIDVSGGIRFIEYNAGLCGGAFCSEGVAEAFLDSPLLAQLQDTHSIRFVGLRDRYLQTFVDGFWRARGRSPESLAVILPPGETGLRLSENPELKALIACAGQGGAEARFASLEGVFENAGSLWDEAGEIDIAIIADWAATLVECPLHHRLWQSRSESGTWVANSLGASVLRSGKHLLAVLSDPSYGLPLEKHERAWIDAHIPWSRLLVRGPSVAPGCEAELVEWVRRNQQSLVLKPCFSRGGRGVSLGWECTRDEWELAVDHALLTPSIVQERVITALESYPISTPAGIERRALAGDLCVFTWEGSGVGGLYCRVSDGGVMNVSAPGGMLVPAFVFEADTEGA